MADGDAAAVAAGTAAEEEPEGEEEVLFSAGGGLFCETAADGAAEGGDAAATGLISSSFGLSSGLELEEGEDSPDPPESTPLALLPDFSKASFNVAMAS
mmetsp:Transcript_19981/g.40697  ORF Transcript_19981/g.40697 Transcript_19981/m.40697 type:complete len:99 (+) Transcript_19981:117-413(+)